MSTNPPVDGLNSEDSKGFLEDLRRETDRGAAVVGGAWLDEQLRQLLAKRLIDKPDEVEELLGSLETGSYAPLGSFAARITAAYCMGLITEPMRNDLKTIAKIRNRFAHRLPGLTFDSAIVKDFCNTLVTLGELPAELPKIYRARDQFMCTVALLMQRIGMNTLQAEHTHERRGLW